jgi:hypothetical protein
MSRTLWRVSPPLHLAEAVRRIALSEGRTDTNTIVRLVSEAVAARRAADASVNKLVAAIRGVAIKDESAEK